MELLLIRHGLPERVVNEDGTPADPPLSAKGRDQAERVARWLEGTSIDRLYSSPLLRARETAQPLATLRGLPVEIEAGVREYDADSSLYIPMEELKEHDYEQWQALVSGGYAPEVDFLAFRSEVVAGVERIIAGNPGRRVAVFCHGGVVNAWAAHVLGMEPSLFIDVSYTSINRFWAASSGERSLGSLNEAAHLRD
ncbi:MAG: histidine phosphatase family protein [Myxococcota bacterium]|nr:histidine phosphatase family protein [Myxococcota bacterium]